MFSVIQSSIRERQADINHLKFMLVVILTFFLPILNFVTYKINDLAIYCTSCSD